MIRPLCIVAACVLTHPASAQDRPKLMPDRDVDVSYRVVASDKPMRQRVRWLAAQHAERIDGGGDSFTLADRTTDFITIVTKRSKTYVKVAEPAGGVFNTNQAADFTRGGDATIAQLPCTEWSWVDASTGKPRTVCATADGVMLRMTEDGHTLVEAITVTYRKVKPKTFQVPVGYEPVLVPDPSGE